MFIQYLFTCNHLNHCRTFYFVYMCLCDILPKRNLYEFNFNQLSTREMSRGRKLVVATLWLFKAKIQAFWIRKCSEKSMFHHYRDKTTFKISMVPSQELLFLCQANLFPLTDGFTKIPNSPQYLNI